MPETVRKGLVLLLVVVERGEEDDLHPVEVLAEDGIEAQRPTEVEVGPEGVLEAGAEDPVSQVSRP